MDCSIEVKRLAVYAHHGVMEQERVVGNHFEISFRLDYPFDRGEAGDDIAATVNYAEAIAIAREVCSRPVALLETVALALRRALTLRWPAISGGYVKVAKPTPPVAGSEVEEVSATVRW